MQRAATESEGPASHLRIPCLRWELTCTSPTREEKKRDLISVLPQRFLLQPLADIQFVGKEIRVGLTLLAGKPFLN